MLNIKKNKLSCEYVSGFTTRIKNIFYFFFYMKNWLMHSIHRHHKYCHPCQKRRKYNCKEWMNVNQTNQVSYCPHFLSKYLSWILLMRIHPPFSSSSSSLTGKYRFVYQVSIHEPFYSAYCISWSIIILVRLYTVHGSFPWDLYRNDPPTFLQKSYPVIYAWMFVTICM